MIRKAAGCSECAFKAIYPDDPFGKFLPMPVPLEQVMPGLISTTQKASKLL